MLYIFLYRIWIMAWKNSKNFKQIINLEDDTKIKGNIFIYMEYWVLRFQSYIYIYEAVLVFFNHDLNQTHSTPPLMSSLTKI